MNACLKNYWAVAGAMCAERYANRGHSTFFCYRALGDACRIKDKVREFVSSDAIYLVTTWAIPVIVAITFHEAAHGFVAHLLGDDTAWRLGRVSFNPAKHVDPFGTILLPSMLLLFHAPFLFGYAKPVPVNFRALRSPRRDMVLVAAAGPVMNIALALVAAMAFHIVGYLPGTSAEWLADQPEKRGRS